MFTYQVRPRVFKLAEGQTLSFPNSVDLLIEFGAKQSFGMGGTKGRTAVFDSKASILFNGNTGEHFVESVPPLDPLEVNIEEPDRKWELRGNKLQIHLAQCDSNVELTSFIESMFFGFPLLLSVEFADPPVISRISGTVGDVAFAWELAGFRFGFSLVSQQLQEERFIESFTRFSVLSVPEHQRLRGALHYFHVACRLARAGHSPWEFLAEVILNLSKTLESLFPGDSRDGIRTGLITLGYTKSEIERDFIPVTLMRDAVSVAHVDLRLYKLEDLQTLHAYADAAEQVLRKMLSKMLSGLADGSFKLEPHEGRPVEKDTLKIIETMRKNLSDAQQAT